MSPVWLIRLPVVGRWSIADRFMIVRGPTVDDGARIAELFLAFEGDLTLATIVSKALLLVDDRAITHPTITRQIGAAAS